MKIFLAGGGTGGATAPVLAVAEAIADLTSRKSEFFLVGSRGVEKKMIADSKFPLTYLVIPAGKLRRYFSLRNFVDVFKIFAGFLKSIYLIRKYQPDVIFGAGSFVQVPLSYAALLLRVPVVIHQPDVDVLLSTRLVAYFAKAVTVSFSITCKNISDFSGLFKKSGQSKIHVTGNPVRRGIYHGSKSEGRRLFELNDHFPVMLVMGGSQGSARINEVIAEAAPMLVKYVQVIHITGRKIGKQIFAHPHYHPCEYLGDDLKHAYAAADFVFCRAGISTISELAALRMLSVIIPLPSSPQETNARLLAYTGSAVVVPEEFLNAELVVSLARKVMWQHDAVQSMRSNIGQLMPPDAGKKIAKIILKLSGS